MGKVGLDPYAEQRTLSQTMRGKIYRTNNCGNVVVLNYYSALNITVQFVNTGNIKKVRRSALESGKVADKESYLIQGVGYIGHGSYSWKTHFEIHNRWTAMLNRCYDPKSLAQNPAYIDCSVCAEWLNFQNFAKWFEENANNPFYEIDKDVVDKHSRLYSPTTCILLPKIINQIFVKRKSKRGELPIGVSWNRNKTGFVARLSNKFGFKTHLGTFNDSHEAFMAYKVAKEKLIKYAANQFKDELSERAYKALMDYQVDITD